MPTRTKLPVREMIPREFAHFMSAVVAAIDQGDMSAWAESDDLLQCERAFGGLYDKVNGRYGFAYFVDSEEEVEFDVCWYFDLDRPQIRAIASGEITHLDLWRCDPECGRRFPRSDYPCEVCDPSD